MLRRLVVVLSLLGAMTAGAPTSRAHLSDYDAALPGTTTTVTGSAYSFSTLLASRPVRWDPCTAIHWRYRTAGQITGGFTQVVRAIARFSRATGTTWVYDGPVTTAPTSAWLPRHADQHPPVLIGWTTASHSDLLATQSPTVLGVTRTAWFSQTKSGVTTAAIRGAVVALNQSKRLPLTGSVSWYTVLLHELSHAMGLGHATSSRELMFPTIQPGLLDLQAGDLVGLSRVGRSAGCIRF
jgi:hypothetical protein